MNFTINQYRYSVSKQLLPILNTIGYEHTPINQSLEGVTEFLCDDEKFIKYGEMPGNVRISEYCNESRTLTMFVNHSLNQAMLCSYCPPPPKRIPRPWKN